jgi:hypothetical protein
MTTSESSPVAAIGTAQAWTKPTVEDFDVAVNTQHRFTVDIDNYEGDNPVGYGS